MKRTHGKASGKLDQLFVRVLDSLNEAQARWFVAREVIARGRGGLKELSELTGMSRTTLVKGIAELESGEPLDVESRIRKPGGGRKRIEVRDPGLPAVIEKIMDENTAGDPMNHLRWTHKSTGRIADELTRQGHPVSADTVGRRLQKLGYSLQVNTKSLEGASPPERDEQFRYINQQVKRQMRRGDPVLSIDTKKKEKVGLFRNGGRAYRKRGDPKKVNVYDFPHLAEGTAIPYGTYDVDRNEGFVNVGVTRDTAEFAVESIRRWWKLVGQRHYPNARTLLLCADGGGSNASRTRTWKYFLQQMTNDLGLQVTVCHYPPGTSKWNKIEHRMFSHISMNWSGQPLTSYQTIINLIGSTKTKTGLKIKARLDTKAYEKGIEITDEQMETINLKRHETHPQWNYTISPETT